MLAAIMNYLWFNSFLISGIALLTIQNTLSSLKEEYKVNHLYLENTKYQKLKSWRTLFLLLVPFNLIGVAFIIGFITDTFNMTTLDVDTIPISNNIKYGFVAIYLIILILLTMIIRKRKKHQKLHNDKQISVQDDNILRVLQWVRVYLILSFALSYEYFKIILVNIMAGHV